MSKGMFNTVRIEALEKQLKELIERIITIEKEISALKGNQ